MPAKNLNEKLLEAQICRNASWSNEVMLFFAACVNWMEIQLATGIDLAKHMIQYSIRRAVGNTFCSQDLWLQHVEVIMSRGPLQEKQSICPGFKNFNLEIKYSLDYEEKAVLKWTKTKGCGALFIVVTTGNSLGSEMHHDYAYISIRRGLLFRYWCSNLVPGLYLRMIPKCSTLP